MDKAEKSTWIKNPLKVWTGNQLGSTHSADGGIVVSGDRIVELVPQAPRPRATSTTPWTHRDVL